MQPVLHQCEVYIGSPLAFHHVQQLFKFFLHTLTFFLFTYFYTFQNGKTPKLFSKKVKKNENYPVFLKMYHFKFFFMVLTAGI